MAKLAKNLSNPKDKEKYFELKEKYYREFLARITVSNGLKMKFPKGTFPPYKYYIGRGNNSMLVRACLKQRFWWSMGDFYDWEDYNFMWTQWKSNKILDVLKSHTDVIGADQQRTNSGESLLSTQPTTADSNSSQEKLITTPTRKKRTSNLSSSSFPAPVFSVKKTN